MTSNTTPWSLLASKDHEFYGWRIKLNHLGLSLGYVGLLRVGENALL